jgi:CMP/dCMP kinase
MTAQQAAVATVAVDGAAGSGKSSVSRGGASDLGMAYLDTGAMYRAITLWMLRHDVDPTDTAEVAASAGAAARELVVDTDPTAPRCYLGDVEVTTDIRTPEVTAAVSAVSAVPQVRQVLVQRQRQAVAEAIENGVGIIVEGRDIGTVVLPDAEVKVFLVADPLIRAQRRAAEDAGRGHEVDVESTAASLAARDAADSTRAASPLTQADDAIVVDGTWDDLPTVIAKVRALVEGRP